MLGAAEGQGPQKQTLRQGFMSKRSIEGGNPGETCKGLGRQDRDRGRPPKSASEERSLTPCHGRVEGLGLGRAQSQPHMRELGIPALARQSSWKALELGGRQGPHGARY